MNILQLISSEGYYGTENMLLQLSGSLRELSCNITAGVFENLHRPNLEVAEQIRRQGIPVEVIRCRGRLDWDPVRRIRACIEARRIDVVHTHGYKANFYAYAAIRPLGLPLVATCHNWPGKTIPLLLYYWLDHIILKRFDRVAVVSNDVAQSLRRAGIAPEKISLIENGIDVSTFKGCEALCEQISKPPLTMRIAVVGRLAPEKGIQFFLRAAREVLLTHPDTEFLLVGDGPQRAELESLARRLQIEKQVIFTGARSDMPRVYASMDVFVLPSLNEGMPLALLEAMAAGKAVVATRVGAIPNLITSEHTGLMIEPRDVPALRDSILRLMRDPELRRRLGRTAQNTVKERYSAEAMASSYYRMYRELVDNRAAA